MWHNALILVIKKYVKYRIHNHDGTNLHSQWIKHVSVLFWFSFDLVKNYPFFFFKICPAFITQSS